MNLSDLLDDVIVTNQRRSQYHDDSHHPSNWCKICGYYYCWHIESPVALERKYAHFYGARGHKFVPDDEMEDEKT